MNAWHHTYGPWQFPEKLIPLVILKAAAGEPIPLYGDGANVREWLYVEDHVDALLLAANRGALGGSYCMGGHRERTNKQVVEAIFSLLDELKPTEAPHSRLITPVADRPGHDRRYAIDRALISDELGWQPRHDFEGGWRPLCDGFWSSRAGAAGCGSRAATAVADWGRWRGRAEPNRSRMHVRE